MTAYIHLCHVDPARNGPHPCPFSGRGLNDPDGNPVGLGAKEGLRARWIVHAWTCGAVGMVRTVGTWALEFLRRPCSGARGVDDMPVTETLHRPITHQLSCVLPVICAMAHRGK